MITADVFFGTDRRHYAWLAPESTVHISVFKKLLAAHDQRLRNGPLHDLLIQAYVRDKDLRATAILPADQTARNLRMEICKVRAKGGLLEVYREELMSEAAFQTKLSWLGGMEDAAKKADKLSTSSLDRLHSRDQWGVMDLAEQMVTLTALLAKFAGDTLNVSIEPIKKLFQETIARPVWDKLGQWTDYAKGYKSTIEENYDAYVKSLKDLDQRIALLNNIVMHQNYRQAMNFVKFMRTGKKGGCPSC